MERDFVMKISSWAILATATVLSAQPASAKIMKCSDGGFHANTKVAANLLGVVDGDTVHISVNGQDFTVRLLTIDTPETHYEGHSQGYWGEQAALNLQRLAGAVPSAATIELESEPCDKYGRVLAHVFVKDVNLNLEQLKAGMAVNYCIAPNLNHCAEYAPVVQTAIDQQLGIFSDADLELPYLWRRAMSGREADKYVGSLSGKQVYLPNQEDLVEVADRVYFLGAEDIQPPYYLAD